VKPAALVVCALLIAVACGPRRLQQPQAALTELTLIEAFDAARLRVEFHRSPIEVLVIGPSIDDSTTSVLKHLRQGILLSDVPISTDLILPARYFLLKSLQLTGDTGTLVGTLGPLPAQRPGGVPLLACGTTFNIDLDRSTGKWQAKVSGITVC